DPDGYTIAASGGDITGAELSRRLQSTNILIQSVDGIGSGAPRNTPSGGVSGAGNIDVNDNVSRLAGTMLYLHATNPAHVHAAISGPNGGLTMSAGTDINVNAPSSVQVASLTATAGGDVNINSPQTWTNPGAWTFNATNINVNDTVSWSAGTATLNAGYSGG